ncbi:unnamed protein product, partial [Musa textilis]
FIGLKVIQIWSPNLNFLSFLVLGGSIACQRRCNRLSVWQTDTAGAVLPPAWGGSTTQLGAVQPPRSYF